MSEKVYFEEIGKVVKVSGPLIKIEGLPTVKMEEVVKIGDRKAIIFQFDSEFAISPSSNKTIDVAYALALDNPEGIKAGEKVERTGEVLKIPVGEKFLGKVINPLGEDYDTKILIEGEEFRSIEREAPKIMERERVSQPLETGIKIIDALFPIGRGQRELILGDRKTGKTTIALDTIVNQKDVICIYTSIGQRKAEIVQIIKFLSEKGALDYTTLVVASSSDSVVLQYLAPFSAMTLGEYFRDKGKDVLIVFDDLTKHAWAWREISLLLERPPGRESYPGDIFYLHSRLLERAAKIKKELGGGSITALPICQTKEGDISEYIPTNLISITDGQLYLESDLFQKGFKPAINIGLSVSRIGAQAQRKYLSQATAGLKLLLSQHQELKKLLELETKLSEKSQKIYKRGELLLEIFKQEKGELVDSISQSIIYMAVLEGFLDDLPLEKVKEFEKNFYRFLEDLHPEFKKEIEQKGWNLENKKKLKNLIEEFKNLE